MIRFAFSILRMQLSFARLFLPLIALLLISDLRAQQLPEIDALAKRMAGVLARSKQKSVVVFDFFGADDKQRISGRKLADEFSSSLQGYGRAFQVVDRSKVKDLIESYRLAPEIVRTDEIGVWLASKLHAQAFIIGKLSIEGGQLKIDIDSYRIEGQKRLDGFAVYIRVEGGLKDLLDASSSEVVVELVSPTSVNSVPRCVFCPNPAFTDEAIRHHTSGTVILSVVVGESGSAHDIRVVKSQPDGLTVKAIETIQNWTFQPARGLDGKIKEVRVVIELAWHLR